MLALFAAYRVSFCSRWWNSLGPTTPGVFSENRWSSTCLLDLSPVLQQLSGSALRRRASAKSQQIWSLWPGKPLERTFSCSAFNCQQQSSLGFKKKTQVQKILTCLLSPSFSITGTAILPQLSPAMTVLKSSRFASITDDVARRHCGQSKKGDSSVASSACKHCFQRAHTASS